MTVHLISSVGIGDYREILYRYGGRDCRTRFAPVAVARLAAPEGGRASILVTPQAKEKWFSVIEAELAGVGFTVEAVDIPVCRNQDQILETFLALSGCVHEGEEVILDVTHALRHLPFVYLTVLAYLVGLKDVKIKGIYYGAEMLGGDGVVPLLDVSPLFDLMEWYHALKSANETGDFRAVAALLRKDSALRFIQNKGDPALARAADAAERFAVVLASGLPLEAGHSANCLAQAIESLDIQQPSAVTSTLALSKLGKVVDPWVLPVKKQHLKLDCEELERQLLLAEWYLDRGSIPTVLLLLREWLVNVVLLAREETSDWLDYGKTRKPVELYLNALSERSRLGLVSSSEAEFASLWSTVAEKRNEFAHAGMKPSVISTDKRKVYRLLERCWGILHTWDVPSRMEETGGCFLISPLGLSPGALFSALYHTRPDRLLIITSKEASHFVPEVLTEAGRTDLKPYIIVLQDAHQGFDEAGRILSDNEELRRDLIFSSQVVANITGGTTAMQYAAEKLGYQIERVGTVVRRVALVDRRDIIEQRRNPYVVGELVVLEN